MLLIPHAGQRQEFWEGSLPQPWGAGLQSQRNELEGIREEKTETKPLGFLLSLWGLFTSLALNPQGSETGSSHTGKRQATLILGIPWHSCDGLRQVAVLRIAMCWMTPGTRPLGDPSSAHLGTFCYRVGHSSLFAESNGKAAHCFPERFEPSAQAPVRPTKGPVVSGSQASFMPSVTPTIRFLCFSVPPDPWRLATSG